MNEQIINNFYEFWSLIGNLAGKLKETVDYKAVLISNSDWPNRIYNINYSKDILEEIIALSQQGELPEIISVPKPNNLQEHSSLEFMSEKKNMAIALNSLRTDSIENKNIFRVETKKDSHNFAKTASEAFGCQVDAKLIFKVCKSSENVRFFNYMKGRECLGCGIVFFDSHNNSGLHMIGTLYNWRGQGIGKSMSDKLLLESQKNENALCVLYASLMGEPIYRKLGFELYGMLETYRILKK
jgi:ribosomal protein S18 acetylase RimI-like enzyme